MKIAFSAVLILVWLAPNLPAAAPYGIDRLELNEPFLNRRVGTNADDRLPPLLSQTGAFEDPASLTPMRALVPYTVNSALWSDGTSKSRWLFIPKNTQIGFTPTNWSFPVGTVFVKHFDLVTNLFTGGKRPLETRFLVVDTASNVFGFTYRWTNTTDAYLLGPGGMLETNMIVDATGANSSPQVWAFPGRDDCLLCHTKLSGEGQTLGVLGVKTAQLNGNYAYPQPGGGTATDNQLRTLNHVGLFQPALNEANIPSLPKMAGLSDSTANLETRVRSYLDANCAHCHSPSGRAADFGAAFDGRFPTPFPNQGLVNTPNNYIKFGDLGKSAIFQRVSVRGSGQMPEIATSIVDGTWTNALRLWILTSFNPTNAQGSALGDQVTVTFNSLPEAASGTQAANYQLVGNGQTNTLSAGSLDTPSRSVTFTVTPALIAGEEYTITINNVLDQATPQNRVWPNSTEKFVAQGGLLGPANDNFNSAIVLTGADAGATGDNASASVQPGEPQHAGQPGGHSIWWAWTAPSNGPVTIDTIGSTFDTLLAVYTGSSVSALTTIAADDDYSSLFASLVTFTAVGGVTYAIAVDGYQGDFGTVNLHLHEGPPPQPPANDLFVHAAVLSGSSGSINATNGYATKEPGEPNHAANPGGASVWWTWTAPADGGVTFDTHGSSFDTTLAVYLGSDVAGLTLVAENDDDGALPTSRVHFTAAAGVTYAIAVDGYYGRTGNIVLNYSETIALAILAPTLLSGELQGGQFVLVISGPAGALVEIQSSEDLIHWSSVTTSLLGGKPMQVTDPDAPVLNHRFYRAVRH